MTLQTFARFAVQHRKEPPLPELQHASARAVVDWFGATIAGAQTKPARTLTAVLLGEEQKGTCALVADGRQVSARTAALINATASHVVEMDDIYRPGVYHPGSPTVGAAFAMAQRQGVNGEEMLRAVAIGYEIGDRISAALQPAHYRYWHTTGTVGTIGAAAAAAEILRLDEEKFAHALATSTTMAAGLQQAFRSEAMSKPLHAGHAAEAGVLAALTAERGFTGALDVLDGPTGFGEAMSESPAWDKAVENLGSDPWGITEPTVKNYACCGHTFAAIDAILALREEGLRPEHIDRIDVATYGTAVKVAGITDPHTPFEAKFSTAYCMAAALSLGTVRLQAFSEDNLWHPDIRNVLARVHLEVDEDFDSRFPNQRAARVHVIDTQGKIYNYVRYTRKGDPDDPLSDTELNDKFQELATPVLGETRTVEMQQALWNLADLTDLRDLEVGPQAEPNDERRP